MRIIRLFVEISILESMQFDMHIHFSEINLKFKKKK